MKNNFFKFFLAFVFCFSALPFLVSAGSEHNMSGWAWSSNIGWISFNCLDRLNCDTYAPGPGSITTTVPYRLDTDQNWRISFYEYLDAIGLHNSGNMSDGEFAMVTAMYNYRSGTTRTGQYHGVKDGANYGVNVDFENAGNLTGFAWSPNIGWIQFGSFSIPEFPSGGGTQKQNAIMEGVNLKGWAKAIAADNNGWDGWLSLSGSSYSVDLEDGKFVGYAWGGDVIGWVLFNPQILGVCGDCGVKLDEAFVLGGVGFDIKDEISESIAGRQDVPYATVPTFEWTFENIPNVSCDLLQTQGAGQTFNPVVIIAEGLSEPGSMTGDALMPEGSYEYELKCTNPNISVQIGFVVAPEPPGFTLTLGDMEIIRIQFLSSGAAESEQKTFFVDAQGSFAEEVMVSVDPSSLICDIPNPDVSFRYSLNYSGYMENPPPVSFSRPYTGGGTFRVKVSKKIDPYCYVDIVGVAAGYPEVRKTFVITPTAFEPIYEEY